MSPTVNLAGYIDGDLESWLQENSDVPAQIARCPLPDTSTLQL